MTETVLCIKRDRLPLPWIGQRSVVPLDFSTFTDQCAKADFEFVPRPQAEEDPSLKQIIPYIVLQTRNREQTAVYNRKGSEKRLHDLWSLGIGGHINPVDQQDGSREGGLNFEQILMAGMARELSEEITRMPEEDQPGFCGVISEEKTPVGRVHLGAVFSILTDRPHHYVPGEELFNFQWKSTRNLGQLSMELWSELTLELLKA
mgnify:CR=1 FL=1